MRVVCSDCWVGGRGIDRDFWIAVGERPIDESFVIRDSYFAGGGRGGVCVCAGGGGIGGGIEAKLGKA